MYVNIGVSRSAAEFFFALDENNSFPQKMKSATNENKPGHASAIEAT